MTVYRERMFSSRVMTEVIKNSLLIRFVLPPSDPMDGMKIDRPGEYCQLTGCAYAQ